MTSVIVILGAAVWPGENPSPTLLRRSRKAALLWADGSFDLIIASGGLGRHPPSEAEIIRRVLLSEGVPDHAILKEDRATSTFTNAQYSLALLHRPTSTQITVVTDGYHRLRTWLIFRDQGARVRVVSSDDCPPYPRLKVRLKQGLREILALCWYLLHRRRSVSVPRSDAS